MNKVLDWLSSWWNLLVFTGMLLSIVVTNFKKTKP